LQQAFSGGSIGHIEKEGNQYKVYVELQEEFQNHPDALGRLHLKTLTGATVPLKAFASWTESLGFPALHRLDQLPSITINFAINKDTAVNEGLDILEKMAKEILPSTVSGKLQGSAAMMATTLRDSSLLIFASILVMYLVLGILYESFIHPLTILSSLPFACLGGVLTLILFGESLSLFSIVGFLLLIGIVKKNGIMMVDYALEATKYKNLTPEQAIIDGCLVRFRPIMMTTIAAIMGALPIAIGIGDGSELRRGLGLVIAGGLLFSQLFTLYVTPVIYLTLERMVNPKPVLEKKLVPAGSS
jgi:HAE1 family hydrophobic/amphiphilic exporter-1